MSVNRRWSWWLVGVVAVIVVGAGVSRAEEAAPAAAPQEATPAAPVTVQDDMDVAIDYTLTVDGAVVDSTEGKVPFRYIQGKKQVIPGLERALTGMQVGEAKDVTVGPEDGYGPIDQSAFVEVSKDQLPGDIAPEVGQILRGVNPDGQSFRAKISEMKDKTVVLDLNHPLAGKTLNFKVKIAEIKPAVAP